MSELIFEKDCGICSGNGVQPVVGGPCKSCGGDGRIYWGNADALMEKLESLDTKLDALDVKMDTLDAHLDAIETKIDALP